MLFLFRQKLFHLYITIFSKLFFFLNNFQDTSCADKKKIAANDNPLKECGDLSFIVVLTVECVDHRSTAILSLQGQALDFLFFLFQFCIINFLESPSPKM